MKHYKAFLAMLRKTGVVFKIFKKGRLSTVIVRACRGPRNEGEEGLYTAWVFYSGSLQSVGSWQGI